MAVTPQDNTVRSKDFIPVVQASVDGTNAGGTINVQCGPDGKSLLVSLAGGAGGGNVTIAGPFGQANMANSFPVTIASDQSAISVTSKASVVAALTTNKTVSVANTATPILAANASRNKVIIVNNDPSTDIYLGNTTVTSGAAAGANGGILLKANGAGVFYDDGAGGEIYTGGWSGITASGNAIVSVIEY